MATNTLTQSQPYCVAMVSPILAAGTTQATATVLYGNNVLFEVLTCAAGAGVLLPNPRPPASITIFNATANACLVYPLPGSAINNGTPNAPYSLPAGVSIEFRSTSHFNWYSIGLSAATGVGTGSVTTASVVTANGFGGTVANPTTTPAITLTTSITGMLKGTGTALAAAISDTDYQAPISLTTTGSSGAATFTGNVLNVPNYVGSGGSGTVTTVSVVSANGLGGTVANPTTAPAITLTTSITGIVKGTGTAFAAAVSDTDYQAPISLTTTGSTGAATFSGNVLNVPVYTGGGGSALLAGANIYTGTNEFAGQVWVQEYNVGSVTGAVTINWANGNTQYLTMTGAVTLSFTNPEPGGKYTLHLAGAFGWTLPGTVRVSNGAAISPTALAAHKDILSLIYSGVESLYDVVASQNYAIT